MKVFNDGTLFERVVQISSDSTRITCAKHEQKLQMGHRVASFVDFSLGIDGRVVFMDAKVTKDRLWNLLEYAVGPKKIHQFKKLQAADSVGNKAGYLVWFKDYKQVSWVPVEAIMFALKQQVKSIHPGSELVNSRPFDIALGQLDLRDLIFKEPYLGKKD